MSNRSFEYLAAILKEYFEKHPPIQGQRYHIHVEKNEQVEYLYNALCQNSDDIFSYKNYVTKTISCQDVKILLAASINNYPTEGFLTRLRNLTANQEGAFSGHALLIIHNTSLDSILGGAEDLTKEGNPLHIKSFRETLTNSLQTLKIHENEKKALNVILKAYNSTIHEDSSTIFSYKPFMEILHKDTVDNSDWIYLGMFADPELTLISDKRKISKRVTDNRQFFEDIQRAHRLNPDNLEEELSKKFIKAGVSQLKRENWERSSYAEVKKWNENKKNKIPNHYIEPDEIYTDEALFFWDRREGDTAAAIRKRHIIIFNPGKNERIRHKFIFDKGLTQKGVILQNKSSMSASTKGNKLNIEITGCNTRPQFEQIRYKDNETKALFYFYIAVLPFSFEILNEFKSSYLIRPKDKKLLLRSDGSFIFNKKNENETSIDLEQDVVISLAKDTRIIARQFDDENSEETLKFQLDWNGQKIDCEVIQDPIKRKSISGVKIWKLKREKAVNFEYVGDNKLLLGNDEYFTNKERILKFLEFEKKIIEPKPQDCHWIEVDGNLKPQYIEINEDLRKSFLNLLNFYHSEKLLPSLTTLSNNQKLTNLSKSYVDSFIQQVESIPHNIQLGDEFKRLMLIGTIESMAKEKQILLTPLHPLNVCYQLAVIDELKREEVPEEILSCFGYANLLPYINGSEASDDKFISIRETELMEWAVYRPFQTSHHGWHNEYVHKLIANKIFEYVKHFEYLFTGTDKAPIRINLVHMGDCIDALKGIIRYYTKSIKDVKGDISKVQSISLSIYGEKNGFNIFEEFALYADSEKIISDFGIKLQVEFENIVMDNEEILRIIRDKLNFFIKKPKEKPDYSHITFIKFDPEAVQWTYQDMNAINTGCSLSGLINAVPSVFMGDSYITGFGKKGSCPKEQPLLKIASSLNSLSRVDKRSDPFNEKQTTFFTFRDAQKEWLNNIYDSSNWVTFIEPKVDLNFFKQQDKTKDLIIIHYSDQYNNSSGYDAITVTRKSKQYRTILREFLEKNKIEYSVNDELKLINLFNAINGDWLLRMISGRAHFSREKISILSAVKIMLAILDHPDIVWVPLSLEEVLRVTGNTGLKQKDGLFSQKNLQPEFADKYCDDILMAGVEISRGHKPTVHFLPVEVKIGNDQTPKGKLQSSNTAHILKKYLSQDSFRSKFYRNFFAKLIIMASEKMELYDVFKNQNWEKISKDCRQNLLNDDYHLNWNLCESFGSSAVLSFKKDIFKQSIKKEDDNIIIDMLERDAHDTLLKEIDELIDRYRKVSSDLDQELLLYNCYSAHKEKSVPPPNEDSQSQTETSDSTSTGNSTDILSSELTVKLGEYMTRSGTVDWKPLELTNPHCMILGASGKGKTQTLKSIIFQLSKQKIPSIIIDFNDDFINPTFIDQTGFELIDTAYGIPINPFEIAIDPYTNKKVHYKTVVYSLPDTLNAIFDFGTREKRKVAEAIEELFTSHGFSQSQNTWDNKVPDFLNLKYGLEQIAEDQPKESDRIHNILSKLGPVFDLQLFGGTETTSFDEYFKKGAVFRLKSLLGFGSTIQKAMMQFILEKVYNRMATLGHTDSLRFLCVIDEAHYLKMNEKIDNLAKEARKFGISLILSTQEAKDLSPSVWANTATLLSLGLTKKDADTVVANLGVPKSDKENISIQLQNFGPGESLIKNDKHSPFDAVKIKPYDKIVEDFQN